MVRRTFKYLDMEDFRLLYNTYIRPHQEFCNQDWSPHFVKDIAIRENVQKAATNPIPMPRKYSYPVRLRIIGITSLEERRVICDMIEVLTGKEKIDYKQSFNFTNAPYSLRGHEKKLAKDRSRLDTRIFFFSQRLVNGWNDLPAHVNKLDISQQFQERLYDRYYCKDVDNRS